ncbi:hypothetical protein SAMN05216326_12574 [Nitrosomonas marina]|uniref:Phage tail sheath protein n=1 Tax=Nitrosomonas marina TaxID=917 RepID=A0A1I0E8X0_9PROT|nr:hypothetical protein [Nitrosomonas marina]SET41610.1 hypothetical protein SAMN05216326_12574 [Nitrosomonas marina]
MSAQAFVRQLGEEPGVQLNPLRDQSEIPAFSNADQNFGIMMRATRGRIDKPFKVDRGNVRVKLGKGEQVRVSALNEAWVHVVEALNNGAYEAVVQRLVTDAAEIKWALVEVDSGTQAITYSVSDTEPVAPYFLSIKHLGCFNDGIKVRYRADEKKVGGVAQVNDEITLQILDSDDVPLYEFFGSLDIDAKDDYGNSLYLPDVVASFTDELEVSVGVTGVDATVATTSDAYGYDTGGQEKWSKSNTLVCFDEGGTGYVTEDYSLARVKLENTPFEYEYISSGGSQSAGLLGQLAQLAHDTNRQLRFDVPGNLTVDAAVAFVEQLNFGASLSSHLLHAYWSPIKSDDPTGINPKGYFGVATLNIAYGCGRNAQRNARGFAPKNYPIAGRNWPIRRTRMSQETNPSRQQLNALAKAKVNPVLWDQFSGGGRFVFTDSLTSALVVSSLKKLIAVADMSAEIDDNVTRYGKDVLQLPMEIALKRLRNFLTELFEGAEASGWLVPSNDPEMEGRAWRFDIRPNAQRPYDRIDCSYWLRYDGTVRQIFVTQTLSR